MSYNFDTKSIPAIFTSAEAESMVQAMNMCDILSEVIDVLKESLYWFGDREFTEESIEATTKQAYRVAARIIYRSDVLKNPGQIEQVRLLMNGDEKTTNHFRDLIKFY